MTESKSRPSRTKRPRHAGNTIETIVPHYVGDEETKREVLLTLRRILMKYRKSEDAREAGTNDG